MREQSTGIKGRMPAMSLLFVMALLAWPFQVHGQPPGPLLSARSEAPFDLSGYWVSLVTQDWRFRMVVPGKGEFAGIPLNLQAKQFSDSWSAATDTTADKQCEAYGAAVLMRNPERLNIVWQDDNTLRVNTDAGTQTRLLHFSDTAPGARSWQGSSKAQWLISAPSYGLRRDLALRARGAAGGTPRWGSLEVETTNMLGGLLRKNGVPYSDRTTLKEYWALNSVAGLDYLIITSMVNDPVYLRGIYYTTPIFTRETDGSKWHPTPCTLMSVP